MKRLPGLEEPVGKTLYCLKARFLRMDPAGALLHEKQIAGLLDGPGNVTLLDSGQTGDATGKDFARVGYPAGKDLNVRRREF